MGQHLHDRLPGCLQPLQTLAPQMVFWPCLEQVVTDSCLALVVQGSDDHQPR